MIKNIIFDLGNVLYDIDESSTEKALIGLLDPAKSKDLLERVIYPFDKGSISEEAFYNRLQRRAYRPVDGIALRNAWNAMLIGFPNHRFELLRSLKKDYRLFLLSNNNIVHYRYLQKQFKTQIPEIDFDSYFFDKAYYSFKIGQRKPEAECYQYVLDDADIIAQESLFIDDKIENTEAAKDLGFKTHCHNPAEDISSILPKLLRV